MTPSLSVLSVLSHLEKKKPSEVFDIVSSLVIRQKRGAVGGGIKYKRTCRDIGLHGYPLCVTKGIAWSIGTFCVI